LLDLTYTGYSHPTRGEEIGRLLRDIGRITKGVFNATSQLREKVSTVGDDSGGSNWGHKRENCLMSWTNRKGRHERGGRRPSAGVRGGSATGDRKPITKKNRHRTLQ